MKKIPIIPLIIGVIFTLSLIIIIATTFMLRKDLLHEQGIKLEGKYETRYNADFVGSKTCKNCHERTYLNWRTSLHSRMMKDVKVEPYANIGDFESASTTITDYDHYRWRITGISEKPPILRDR